MTPFEIEILYHNESTKMLKEMDINFSYESLDRKKCMLFEVQAAHSMINHGREYTEIYVSGGVFTAPMTYRQFLELYIIHNR